MEYTVYENLSEKSGVASNLHGFMNRFLDTGFKDKWTGYWAPPYKFLDYYALKINGVWLDEDTLECTNYGSGFTFHHETDSFSIRERVETPDSLPGFRLVIEITNETGGLKAVQTVLEAGIDIRHKTNDIGPEEYGLEKKNSRLSVTSDRKLMISSENSFRVDDDGYTKEHYPGERQRCFVPGDIVFREELEKGEKHTVEVDFTTSGGSFGSIKERDQQLGHELGRTFNHSINSLENLLYNRDGKGIIAGHPWFQSYWARDSYWSLLGLIDAGYFELAQRILENFVEKGRIGSRIELGRDGKDSFPRFDGEPLFVIASEKLRCHWKISETIRSARKSVMKELELKDGIVQHDPEASWMDTLERPSAVDIQSLWLEAAKIIDDPRKEELERGLARFSGEEYMLDHLGEDAPKTINPAVPLMFDQVGKKKAEEYLETINAEFSSRYGARTRSMADPGYRSEGYHTGSVWGLTTGWAATANLKYGNYRQGLNFLKKMTRLLDRNQLGALPETVDAETGRLLGASEQAWSAGLTVHAIDSYLLGIRPSGEKVVIDPAGSVSCTRTGKRVGNQELDLKFNDGEVEVLNDPGLELEIR